MWPGATFKISRMYAKRPGWYVTKAVPETNSLGYRHPYIVDRTDYTSDDSSAVTENCHSDNASEDSRCDNHINGSENDDKDFTTLKDYEVEVVGDDNYAAEMFGEDNDSSSKHSSPNNDDDDDDDASAGKNAGDQNVSLLD